MRPTHTLTVLSVDRNAFAAFLGALLLAAASAAAQTTETAPAPPKDNNWEKPIVLQYYRPVDQRGINVFETPKVKGPDFTGFKLDFGAAFTSQLQAVDHSNTAAPNIVNGVNTNQLADIGTGFNNSTANLYLHAQLAPGVRVALTSYLSSRHHNETWVKDGYLLVDELPFNAGVLNLFMNYVTVKAGHFEINYGDAHFRRSDNGNAVYNPFVGNYILDAFTTEIGGEVMLRSKGIIAMGGFTGGEIRGTVLTPGQRGPSYLAKLGVDRQVKKDLRVRVTGSVYKNDKSINNTLYGGDRAGSRYYYVMENTTATESGQPWSGSINPGFKNQVLATQLNPFVKFRGLEVFGVLERSKGRASSEAADRVWKQYAADVVYRFLPGEKVFVGSRYNRAEGAAAAIAGTVGADRWEFGGGWFVIPHLLIKGEYVSQEYFGWPANNIKNGGKFDGAMLEGVIAF